MITKEQFLAGAIFTSNSLRDRKYQFFKAEKRDDDHAGRLVELTYSGSLEYHCNVKSVNKTGFNIYKTVAGRIVRMRLRFEEFIIFEIK